jgi:hypothetical protein
MVPEQFIEILNQPEEKEGLRLDGFARKGRSTDSISFSGGGSCCNWIEIPVSMVESIELHDTASCGEAGRRVVTLRMKIPSSPEAIVYARLAQVASSKLMPRSVPHPVLEAHGTPIRQAVQQTHPTASSQYTWYIDLELPGVLICGDKNAGCSPVVYVDALGQGQFCDYFAFCFGNTQRIFYNIFKRWA